MAAHPARNATKADVALGVHVGGDADELVMRTLEAEPSEVRCTVGGKLHLVCSCWAATIGNVSGPVPMRGCSIATCNPVRRRSSASGSNPHRGLSSSGHDPRPGSGRRRWWGVRRRRAGPRRRRSTREHDDEGRVVDRILEHRQVVTTAASARSPRRLYVRPSAMTDSTITPAKATRPGHRVPGHRPEAPTITRRRYAARLFAWPSSRSPEHQSDPTKMDRSRAVGRWRTQPRWRPCQPWRAASRGSEKASQGRSAPRRTPRCRQTRSQAPGTGKARARLGRDRRMWRSPTRRARRTPRRQV